MDVLWSPWRYDYITKGSSDQADGCVFCGILNNSASDEENLILHRAEFNFVILNAYPYGTGHLMILPYSHIADISDAEKRSTDELMDLTKSARSVLAKIYNPEGFNVGMNLGKAAGAGVADHYHMHVLPRWIGDVNFLTSIGQTRVIPEPLSSTYAKLKGKF